MLRDRRLRSEAAAELELYGLEPREARQQGRRAVALHHEFRQRQRELNEGDPSAVAARIDGLREQGERPPADEGALLLTLHYGLYPLLWLWLKSRLPRFTLLYASDLYRPDVPPAQYARFAALGLVPADRNDLDLAALGPRPTLDEARRRLEHRGSVLVFPDANAVEPDRPGALVCRVGALTVAYPGGAAALARTPDVRLQGVVLVDGTVVWGDPRRTPCDTAEVADVLQELFELSVARDPAPWQAWFSA